jgi:DNA-binding LacI/PurR family transcriptional regulator/anti-anti-sigma regulatory factor
MGDIKSSDEATRATPKNSHPTVGLLTYGATDPNSHALWSWVDSVTRKHGANLVCFPANPLRSPRGFESQANVLYDLVGAENVDGLVIWGTILAYYVGAEEVRVFCERYRPIPIVSVALSLKGFPSVVVDNYQGMRDAVLHLIEAHGYRRIAFIRGPAGHPEAEERYRAYADALAEYDVPLDPTLVAPGDFKRDEGAKAIDLLLDQREASFEAVVAANDVSAFGALEALRTRGIRVPDDVAIVGFDDTEESAHSIPPLTTARQSYAEMGKQATMMLLAQLQGDEVPEQVIVPSQLVVRQSCGCLSSRVVQAAVEDAASHQVTATTAKQLKAALTAHRRQITSDIAQSLEVTSPSVEIEGAEQLFDAFVTELEGGSQGGFITALGRILRQTVGTGSDVTSWQGALSTLRRHTLPTLSESKTLSVAENLWHQARVMVGEVMQEVQAYRQLQAEQQAETLREIGQTLISTFDVAELTDVLVQELPRLGIERAYLSLYQDPQAPTEWSRLIFAYDEDGRVQLEAGGQRFRSSKLVPDNLSQQHGRHSKMVEALYFREKQIGFALFEVGPRETGVYDTLRGQISCALEGALLLEERKQAEKALEKAYTEVEKQVEERSAELQRETVERERLQQEVIDAQRRAIQELSTPVIPVMERIIVMPMVGSIDTMRARDITRSLLAGIREHKAKVVILDITGVPIVDSGVADHLNKTIQAARLKGAQTIVTGISDAVAEAIVDLGIDWSGVETLGDLRTGLVVALNKLGIKLTRQDSTGVR